MFPYLRGISQKAQKGWLILMRTEENHILQALPKKEYETLLPERELVTLALS
jgi:hypothetical protein